MPIFGRGNASVTCTTKATYALTQADLNAGKVDNHAIVNGTSVAGPAKAEADAQVKPSGVTSLKLAKDLASSTDVNGNGVLDPGDTLKYTFTLTNTGSLTLKNLVLTDDKLALTAAPLNATLCGSLTAGFDPAAGLAPGTSVTCVPNKTYTITANDVANGQHVLNVATSAGSAPDGSNVPSNQATKDVPLATPANLGLSKTAGAVSPLDPDIGKYTATYQIKLSNGGQTPANYTMVDTPKFSPSLVVLGATWSGQSTGSATGSGPFALGTGSIAGNSTSTWNIVVTFAYAAGAPQAGICQPGMPNTGLFNEASVADRMSATACTEPPARPTSSRTLVKKAGAITDANNNKVQDAGDTIAYTFDVKNTGAVTLTNVAVTDPKVGAVNCPQTTLAPGASMTCTAAKAYTLTQADVDAKNVHNDATANGTPPPGVTPPTPPTSSTETPVTPHNAIALDKFVVRPDDTNANNRIDAGDHVVYGFKITNTGSSTLSQIVLADPKLAFTMNVPGTLAPVASLTVSKDDAGNEFKHLLTPADIDAGSYVNTATVTATGPGPESPTPATPKPSCSTRGRRRSPSPKTRCPWGHRRRSPTPTATAAPTLVTPSPTGSRSPTPR